MNTSPNLGILCSAGNGSTLCWPSLTSSCCLFLMALLTCHIGDGLPLSLFSPPYWPMNLWAGTTSSSLYPSGQLDRIWHCLLTKSMDAWMDRWKEGSNNDVTLCLDSYQVNQFLPLPAGYKFSPWIRQMIGSVISFFPNHSVSRPTHLHLLSLVDENSGMPWSKRRFVWVSSSLGSGENVSSTFSIQRGILQTLYAHT